jgi:uncharacterized membrane protein
MRDISATIIDLAARGYLQIKEIKHEGIFRNDTDYQFIKLKEFRNDSQLLPHEKSLLRGIFGNEDTFVTLSSLQGSFYTDLEDIRDAVYDAVVRQGFFPRNPDVVRKTYRFFGGAIAGLGVGGAFFQWIAANNGQQLPWTTAAALGVAASGVVIMLFAPILPRKTPRGAQLHEEILGFEEFLTRAEGAELKTAEQQNIFERLLPYAMALGVAELWAKRFAKLQLQRPEWYQGSFSGPFQPVIFTRQLGYASSSMNRSLSVAPRSAGGAASWSSGGSGFSGGFSGGGGGGGGGGAW